MEKRAQLSPLQKNSTNGFVGSTVHSASVIIEKTEHKPTIIMTKTKEIIDCPPCSSSSSSSGSRSGGGSGGAFTPR